MAERAETSRVIVKLPRRGPGYAFDLTPSRVDPLALRAVQHVFGAEVVGSAFSRMHRSTLSYDALMSDFKQYERLYAPSAPIRSSHIYQMTIQSVRDDLSRREKLIPLTTGAVVGLSDFPKAKSPGLPWKHLGYNTKGDVVANPENVAEMRRFWQHIGAGIPRDFPDTCLFARTQVCDVSKQKIRSVWGYPLHVYMEEARFFYPLMDWLKTGTDHKLPIAYGYEMAHGGMVAISELLVRSGEGSLAVMTDWSSFDKSIPPWLIRDVFDLLSEVFSFDQVRDVEGKVWHVRPDRTWRRWKKMVDYFIETPVRTCKGERFLVRGGVPSGSCFTNIVDTIINTIVTRFLCYQTLGFYPSGEMYLGDDGVVALPPGSMVDLDLMAEIAALKFGMTLNRNKSYVTSNIENIHFLGYYNHPIGRPHRDQDLLIVSFAHPERTRRTAEECAAAALGQLWANFDPYLAYRWYEVLMYCCDEFCLDTDVVLAHLRGHAHRHKYLSHVGRNVAALTVPTPNEEHLVLAVLASTIPKRVPARREYSYSELWDRTVRVCFERVTPPHDNRREEPPDETHQIDPG
nr:MAG: reverse transcriptase-like protein [Guiyang partiti-like virus 1]